MATKVTIVWFRQDLRLQDNTALHAALGRSHQRGGAVLPVYIWDSAGEWGWPLGAASRWWLHHSLAALDASLRARGSRLLMFCGDAERVLRNLVQETGAGAVYWNRRYELAAIARDSWIEADLAATGIEVRTFNSSLLHEPSAVANRQGRPFQVFTAYWQTCLHLPVNAPVRIEAGPFPNSVSGREGDTLDALELLGDTGADEELQHEWEPGESGATKRLARFVVEGLDSYARDRDFPAKEGTSRLSPHLHFGEIGPRQVWASVRKLSVARGVFPPSKAAGEFLRQLGWREFAYHLLFNFPHTAELPLREEFSRFRWAEDADGARLKAWQNGQTGYPIVDAGMRQMLRTGWMHNRVRMITASFLVKHLRLPWQTGAAWFWQRLVDADLANNTLGWQWSTGCGADASPYFRIFAPVLQGRRFDPAGDYVRHWVPELSRLSGDVIHSPWHAGDDVLSAAGVRLGENYPRPIVDHATARAEALEAFRSMRAGTMAGG